MLLRSPPQLQPPYRPGTATTHTRPLSSINVPPPKKQQPPFTPSAAAVAAAETVSVEINGKPIEVPGYSTVRGLCAVDWFCWVGEQSIDGRLLLHGRHIQFK